MRKAPSPSQLSLAGLGRGHPTWSEKPSSRSLCAVQLVVLGPCAWGLQGRHHSNFDLVSRNLEALAQQSRGEG